MDDLTNELLALERAGWDSLCTGTGSAFYGRHMTADGRMILAGGFALDRDGVVESLASAPAWDRYELDDVAVVPLTPDAATLVYRGTARRGDEEPFVALMASTYVRDAEAGGWRLAVYQQTPVSG